MSRVAKNPVVVPKGVSVAIDGDLVTVTGPKGTLEHTLHTSVKLVEEGDTLRVEPNSNGKFAHAMSGTTRALVNNMVVGVDRGFEKKLTLIGVGYRAQVQGKALNLQLGFSHPVSYEVPDGIQIGTPGQTEIVVKGTDKQRVGRVAAEIRAYRPPEPYKGKGVRYADEEVVRKEAKKK